jgi:hypothetical protein
MPPRFKLTASTCGPGDAADENSSSSKSILTSWPIKPAAQAFTAQGSTKVATRPLLAQVNTPLDHAAPVAESVATSVMPPCDGRASDVPEKSMVQDEKSLPALLSTINRP